MLLHATMPPAPAPPATLAASPQSLSSSSGPSTPATDDCGEWDDEDQAIMEFLLLRPTPTDAEGFFAGLNDPTEKDTEGDSDASARNAKSAMAEGTSSTKGSRARLTPKERRERHREVVRRSYHRNKQTLKSLKDMVKQLELQFQALTIRHPPSVDAAGNPLAVSASTGRINELKRQCADLDSTSEELRRDAVRLQARILRHQEFARVVQECFDAEAGDGTMEEDSTSEEDEVMGWSLPSSPATSEEDLSPKKRQHKRSLVRPTHVVDIAPPAPIARDACKEVGYSPLTAAAATQLVSQTYEGIQQFTLSGRAVTTGARVLGWEDKRLVDGTAVKFSLRKPFAGQSCFDLMCRTWQCFSDPVCVHHKFRGLMELQILQRVNDDTIIALRDQLSPDDSVIYRCVYLLFRVRTPTGFVICTRSLDDVQLTAKETRKISRRGRIIKWVDMFGWFLFDRHGFLEPMSSSFRETGAVVEYGGTMNFGTPGHVSTLVMDTLSIALRWEGLMVAPIFSLPSSA